MLQIYLDILINTLIATAGLMQLMWNTGGYCFANSGFGNQKECFCDGDSVIKRSAFAMGIEKRPKWWFAHGSEKYGRVLVDTLKKNNTHNRDVRDGLDYGFSWRNTEEGHDYWENLYINTRTRGLPPYAIAKLFKMFKEQGIE